MCALHFQIKLHVGTFIFVTYVAPFIIMSESQITTYFPMQTQYYMIKIRIQLINVTLCMHLRRAPLTTVVSYNILHSENEVVSK